MSLALLKERIKSMRTEAVAMRKLERRALGHLTLLHLAERMAHGGIPERSRHRILSRARSRGAAIERSNSFRDETALPAYVAEAHGHYERLHALRTGKVRVIGTTVDAKGYPTDIKRDESLRAEARALHLAYGFFRSVDFAAMEGKSYAPPDWGRVEAAIRRYAEEDSRIVQQRFAAWKAHAGAWTHPALVEHALRTGSEEQAL